MFEDGVPIFTQLAEAIEADILRGTYPEGAQVPSLNELAVFHRINPATANRAVAQLVDRGVLIKRRGIGMFVADGARQLIADERRKLLVERYVNPLLAEARALGLSEQDLITLITKEATP
ncbi:GntR family transcriptional regulator [Aestuariimicrobium ganziense]|uniref:GntR family transcriptional regulator n=1 Tax=Aestuariimicrobium ganziense TaxID=2773677 RepID=UPI0019432907|nr:GntR family transcriptional regulator [Aestuariimicrobium ganziense]